MCLCPKQIYNPTYNFTLADKVFIDVPCGHCEECRRDAVNDWYVRLNYEFYRYTRNGKGMVYFITLTYNERNLPELRLGYNEYSMLLTYEDAKELDMPLLCVNGFNKVHVRNFFKKLRTYIDRKYRVSDIKYLCVSEYGSKKHRPHYHIAIFLPMIIDAGTFKQLCEKAWSDEIKIKDLPQKIRSLIKYNEKEIREGRTMSFGKTKEYFVYKDKSQKIRCLYKKGIVEYSKKGAVLTRPLGLKYLLKYFAKDSEFMNEPLIKKLRQFQSKLPSPSVMDKGAKRTLVEQIRDFFPFHLTSTKLGEDLFHELDLTQLDATETDIALKKLENNELMLPNETQVYRIPRYIINRLFYIYKPVTTDPDKKYRELTSIGAYCLSIRHEQVINDLTKSYEECASLTTLNKLSDDNKKEFEYYYNVKIEKAVNEIQGQFLVDFLKNYKDLALYKIYYQNINYRNYEHLQGYNFSEWTYDDFRTFAKALEQYKIALHFREPTKGNIRQRSDSQREFDSWCEQYHSYLFNYLPIFARWDTYIQWLNFIQGKLKLIKAKEYAEINKRVRETRSFNNPYN